jgi:hypothetical protein
VRGGFLTTVVTNVSGPNFHSLVGSVSRPLQIVALDAHHLTWKVGEQSLTWNR